MIEPSDGGSRRRVVLGVDPGLARAGWGLIEVDGSRLRAISHGAIATSPKSSHAERLLIIHRGLLEVIRDARPDIMAVEEVFQGKNPRSALLLGEGRGACILAGSVSGLIVVEYPATVIKRALTGNGRAAKSQVASMVCRLLSLRETPRPHDAADALAVAITHAQRSGKRIPAAGQVPGKSVRNPESR